MSDATRHWLGILKREWWVVTIAVLVAAAIPLLLVEDTYSQESVFEARSTITVEAKTLSEFIRLPQVDELLQDVSSDDFIARSAQEIEVPADELREHMRVYSVKSPQSAVVVSYRSEDESEAVRVSEAAAQRVVRRALGIGDDEVRYLRRQIAIVDDAFDDTSGVMSVAESASLRIERERLLDSLSRVRQAYRFKRPAEVSELPAIQRGATGVGGAVLGGLAAGLAIAAVREALLRRRRAS